MKSKKSKSNKKPTSSSKKEELSDIYTEFDNEFREFNFRIFDKYKEFPIDKKISKKEGNDNDYSFVINPINPRCSKCNRTFSKKSVGRKMPLCEHKLCLKCAEKGINKNSIDCIVCHNDKPIVFKVEKGGFILSPDNIIRIFDDCDRFVNLFIFNLIKEGKLKYQESLVINKIISEALKFLRKESLELVENVLIPPELLLMLLPLDINFQQVEHVPGNFNREGELDEIMKNLNLYKDDPDTEILVINDICSIEKLYFKSDNITAERFKDLIIDFGRNVPYIHFLLDSLQPTSFEFNSKKLDQFFNEEQQFEINPKDIKEQAPDIKPKMLDLYNQFLDCLSPSNNIFDIPMSIKDFTNPIFTISEELKTKAKFDAKNLKIEDIDMETISREDKEASTDLQFRIYRDTKSKEYKVCNFCCKEKSIPLFSSSLPSFPLEILPTIATFRCRTEKLYMCTQCAFTHKLENNNHKMMICVPRTDFNYIYRANQEMLQPILVEFIKIKVGAELEKVCQEVENQIDSIISYIISESGKPIN